MYAVMAAALYTHASANWITIGSRAIKDELCNRWRIVPSYKVRRISNATLSSRIIPVYTVAKAVI